MRTQLLNSGTACSSLYLDHLGVESNIGSDAEKQFSDTKTFFDAFKVRNKFEGKPVEKFGFIIAYLTEKQFLAYGSIFDDIGFDVRESYSKKTYKKVFLLSITTHDFLKRQKEVLGSTKSNEKTKEVIEDE